MHAISLRRWRPFINAALSCFCLTNKLKNWVPIIKFFFFGLKAKSGSRCKNKQRSSQRQSRKKNEIREEPLWRGPRRKPKTKAKTPTPISRRNWNPELQQVGLRKPKITWLARLRRCRCRSVFLLAFGGLKEGLNDLWNGVPWGVVHVVHKFSDAFVKTIC